MQSANPHFPAARPAERRILSAIVLLAVAARLGSAMYQGNHVAALPGVADQISYHALAVRVVQGHGFTFDTGWWPATPAGQPTAHWSYLYVLFLAGVYSVFGSNPLAPRILQAVIAGVLQPVITWRIASRLFGPTVGMTAAALASVYFYFVFYGGALMTESLYVVAVLWAVDIAAALAAPSCRESGNSRLVAWIQLGIALACASLLRQVTLLLAPAVLAWAAYRTFATGESGIAPTRKVPAGHLLVRVGVAVTVLVACIVPWTIRNYRAFGQLVVLNTNAGFAFFWGNHPIHGTHFMPLLPAGGAGYGALIPDELRKLNEGAMDRALLLRGLGFVWKDPVRYVRLCASRVAEYVKFWPSDGSSVVSNYARVLSFGACLPFFLSGVMLALCRRTGDDCRPDIWGVALLIGVAALYSTFYLLTWTLVRYRLPVDALLMPFAALSMVWVHGRLHQTAREFAFRREGSGVKAAHRA